MENLYKSNVDTSTVDDLVSGTSVPAKVWPVTITGTGIVKRGTLLARDPGETSYRPYKEPYEEDEEIIRDVIRAVLLQDVKADDPDENEGAAAFSGEFNQNKIEEVMGITVDPEDILDAAEGKKIYIAPMNPAPEAF